MSLDAPDAKALLPERSTSISNSMDRSNFGGITFRFTLQLCGQNKNNGLQIYRAQLSDIETRCNDISGEIEASSNDETHIKMAKSLSMCNEYPLFTSGPSIGWFSVAMRHGFIEGVDFPNADTTLVTDSAIKLQYADQSFKRHFVKDLLFNMPKKVCMPSKNIKRCTHIDRNETLLLTTHNQDTHGKGDAAKENKMEETITRKVSSTYEINKKAELHRVDCFEEAIFTTKPMGLDSVPPIVRKATLTTRWDMVLEKVLYEKDKGVISGC